MECTGKISKLLLQYSGAGHVDKDTGDVVFLYNRTGGDKVGVVIVDRYSSFFTVRFYNVRLDVQHVPRRETQHVHETYNSH